MLQDLVTAAVNEAGRRVDAEIERMTQGMAGGLKIPGLT
jgi:DNA-binding protein YbaB